MSIVLKHENKGIWNRNGSHSENLNNASHLKFKFLFKE